MKEDLTLRPVNNDDLQFIHELNRMTYYENVQKIQPWDEESQLKRSQERMASGFLKIIVLQEKPVGVLLLIKKNDHFFVDYIAILPDFQRQGICRYFFEKIVQEAAQKRVPVQLTVLKENPIKPFYESLAFEVIRTDEHRFYMERPCL
jgi:ribosomal protein S18 acetylase RimI-like enzyme